MIGIALIASADGTAFDLDLRTGKIAFMEVTPQNQAMLLTARPGEYKEHPAIGVGIPDMIMDHEVRVWRRRIVEQIEADGQRIKKINITASGIELEAEYK